ncbi:hypothetical protein QQF64_006741 [Cirrhinus molitorella]|uniref:Uncharacterized protein n=1 Tax=Cirrhinus molitorella TaxID=172907 RepID=A0ABR3MB30_9TELE
MPLDRVPFQIHPGPRAEDPGLKFPAAAATREPTTVTELFVLTAKLQSFPEDSDMINWVTLMSVTSTTEVPLMMGKNTKEAPVKAAPDIAFVASARAGVQGCFSPRAPLSTSLVPEVPAKADLV